MAQGTRLPRLIRAWGYGNALCLVAFVVVGFVLPVYLPIVLVVVLAAALQVAVGLLLTLNYRGIADSWAVWGRGRRWIGTGSASPSLNRLQGAIFILVGLGLIWLAVWMASTLRPLI